VRHLLHRPARSPRPGRPASRRPALAVTAGAAALVLVLAGCGDDGSGTDADQPETSDPFSQVEVVGEPDAPTLEVDAPLSVATTEVDVVTPAEDADAPVVAEGDLVSMDVLAVSGGTGDTLQSTYGSPTQLGLLADPGTTVQGLVTGVVGQQVGSRVLVAVAPEDFPVPTPQTATTTGDGSVVLLIDIEGASTPLERAEGEEVAVPEGLPSVERAEDGAPTIGAAEGDPPAELRVETLVRGTGEEVAEGDTVAVRYTGVVWGETEPFDSAWVDDRPPFVFAVGAGQVIPAWDQGLQGVPVGSQVMVVAPPDTAYGDQEQGAIPAGSTLVFVVDVLAAVPTAR
jgi:FKBP-type peptidyl-prolyl cis-trans isomerase 2